MPSFGDKRNACEGRVDTCLPTLASIYGRGRGVAASVRKQKLRGLARTAARVLPVRERRSPCIRARCSSWPSQPLSGASWSNPIVRRAPTVAIP
jgi:hypothetical protein